MKTTCVQRKRKGPRIQNIQNVIFAEINIEKIQIKMNNARTFLMAFGAALLLMSCGAGTESTGATSAASDQSPCDCLVEMNASLTALMADEQSAERTVLEWTQALSEKTSPCMLVKRTPEELSAWSKAQSACPEFQAYSDLVTQFREQLVAVREATREIPQSMNQISNGGAKELLDQLSKGNQ
tara:strand:+ start:438 stop:986 length:549 start_codon:yes stop_codon:yes gene_type:complete